MSSAELALSIRQPWAELILLGRKTIELRNWDTNYRGPLWLHSGKFSDPYLDQRFGLTNLIRGAFVGRFTLDSISPIDASRWQNWRTEHLDPGRYEPGMLAWILSSPERLTSPLPAAGKLKLYEVDRTLVPQLHARLASS